LAATGVVAMRAFDELDSATPGDIDARLVPYLFNVSKTQPRNRVHAIFVAVCHQLYFAAQRQQRNDGRPPLPFISEGRQVWAPVLLTKVRELKTADYFGIPNDTWRSWFATIKGGIPHDVDFFVEFLKKGFAECRAELATLSLDQFDEANDPPAGDIHGRPPIDHFDVIAENLEFLEFLKKHFSVYGK
jgi:hypothetical protein